MRTGKRNIFYFRTSRPNPGPSGLLLNKHRDSVAGPTWLGQNRRLFSIWRRDYKWV